MAADHELSLTVIVAYRFLFSTFFIVPLALFFERGSLYQNIYLLSLTFVSVTYVTATLNLALAITYVMAVSLRLERIDLRTRAGKAKVFGTLMGIGGATILTFSKGKRIQIVTNHVILMRHVAASDGTSPTLLLLPFGAACFLLPPASVSPRG
ncbi:WAT1-related protein At1g11450-like [Prosopis cineraria]|uniref:WAT1-related protein At1g11450-like n=1 Tax=Prosopis cineraria TaxID=364024 RepID=UPI00240FCEC8|nr:WAT1-related protein At1g11450-like [Prosopis cineraria]